jgi:hypothetical protein
VPRPEPLSLAALEWAATATSCGLLSPENRDNAEVLATQCARIRTKAEARNARISAEAWADFLCDFQYGSEHEIMRLLTRFDNLMAAVQRAEERLTR